MNPPTLHGPVCELANGSVLTLGSLLPWLAGPTSSGPCSARATGSTSASPLLFTGATWRGIELRDRECTHPYCDAPAERCQADHIVEYTQGGLTTQENGRLLCGFHNRLRNQRPPPPGEGPRAPPSDPVANEAGTMRPDPTDPTRPTRAEPSRAARPKARA